MVTTPTPIFVIGMNRTGTKWLSNLLANHPEVAAVQHADHTGILETNALHAWPAKFPDLSPVDEWIALVELWTRTDFFRITGLDEGFFYALDPRPRDVLEAFTRLMEAHAREQGRSHWLQKVDAWSAHTVLDRFPQARFVVIERDREETLRSTHFLITEGRTPLSLRTITSHVLQERLLGTVKRRGGVAVRYDDLRARPEVELERVCRAVGLAFAPALLELPWAKNTSFRGQEARRWEFSARERRRLRVAGFVLDHLPEAFLGALRALFRTRTTPVVGGTFRRIRDEHGLP